MIWDLVIFLSSKVKIFRYNFPNTSHFDLLLISVIIFLLRHRAIIWFGHASFVWHAPVDDNTVCLWSSSWSWFGTVCCSSSRLISRLHDSHSPRDTHSEKFRRGGVILCRNCLVYTTENLTTLNRDPFHVGNGKSRLFNSNSLSTEFTNSGTIFRRILLYNIEL